MSHWQKAVSIFSDSASRRPFGALELFFSEVIWSSLRHFAPRLSLNDVRRALSACTKSRRSFTLSEGT